MSSALTTPAAPVSRAAAAVPMVLVGIVLMMVMPLPPLLLDLMLTASIAFAIAILLISIHLESPLDLSVFPTLLLFTTLFRLALNVASTRLILLHGGEGPDAAGQIIQAFGELIIRGNYVVGGAVFIILVIINFVVITKGAGRVAEVSARFTLDALPGKQMSIDADLASGALTQDEAKKRRKEVEQESDFFGSMDGASKFVRGDAIAAVLMTGINILVGFVVGVLQQDLDAAEAATSYTILAVGDGLASQIPALLVSTAAGVVVTRVSTGAALSPALVEQLSRRRAALYGTAGLLAVIGIMPGLPAVPFLGLAGVLAFVGRRTPAAIPSERGDAPTDKEAAPSEREQIEEMLPVDPLELEVGFDLVPLVDSSRGGELIERIGAIRRNLAMELGMIIPSIHIRDNLRLRSGGYRLMLSGNPIGEGELRVGKLLAMDPTGGELLLEGEPVKEPAFGLPAKWVTAADREKAEGLGYTVVDSATVAATHLTELLRSSASELLGRSEAQELVDILAKQHPRLVDELIPTHMNLGDVIKVLRALLEESVSIRDMRSIFDALADYASETKDVNFLTEKVRERLRRQITMKFSGETSQVGALVLDPRAEDMFRTGEPDPSMTQRMLSSLEHSAKAFASMATPPVLLCSPDIRRVVHQFLSRRVPGLSVLSYGEIDAKTTIKNLGVVTA